MTPTVECDARLYRASDFGRHCVNWGTSAADESAYAAIVVLRRILPELGARPLPGHRIATRRRLFLEFEL
jgi:hypothetical protein